MDNGLIKPYGDRTGDGIVQLSFTLPVEYGARAGKAAELYVKKLNMDNVTVAHAKKIGDNFTFFVVYARAVPELDYSAVKASEVKSEKMSFEDINEFIRTRLKRRIVVIGATIGSDAHTVGIDAIMNMKGYNHDYGLERYPEIDAFNLGAQITIEELTDSAIRHKADAILVSQTVTQMDTHRENCAAFIEYLNNKGIRNKYILIAGGPRITNDLALELGFDAGFGPDTLPSHVASYIVTELEKRGYKDERG